MRLWFPEVYVNLYFSFGRLGSRNRATGTRWSLLGGSEPAVLGAWGTRRCYPTCAPSGCAPSVDTSIYLAVVILSNPRQHRPYKPQLAFVADTRKAFPHMEEVTLEADAAASRAPSGGTTWNQNMPLLQPKDASCLQISKKALLPISLFSTE